MWWSLKPARGPLTIMTHITIDRLYQLESQCKAWPGPIAAIVYFSLALDAATRENMQRLGLEPGRSTEPAAAAAAAGAATAGASAGTPTYTTTDAWQTETAAVSGLSIDTFFSAELQKQVRLGRGGKGGRREGEGTERQSQAIVRCSTPNVTSIIVVRPCAGRGHFPGAVSVVLKLLDAEAPRRAAGWFPSSSCNRNVIRRTHVPLLLHALMWARRRPVLPFPPSVRAPACPSALTHPCTLPARHGTTAPRRHGVRR